jgi:LemA protein
MPDKTLQLKVQKEPPIWFPFVQQVGGQDIRRDLHLSRDAAKENASPPDRHLHLAPNPVTLFRMDSSLVSGLAIFLFVAGVLTYAVILYNGLVRLRNENDRAWANIDVLLKQRHDEIPNLVETVKGYMQHEQQTLLAVTQARTASMTAATIGQKAIADLQVASALRGLFAVAENYPQLRANENFLKLQNRITELEERIADRREFFNDDVNTYNTRIGQIPDVFIASFMGLQRREMFKVSDEDRRQVEVTFERVPGS